jgi:hypothetical protein
MTKLIEIDGHLIDNASLAVEKATGVKITDPTLLLQVAQRFVKTQELWPAGFADLRDSLQVQLPETYSISDLKIDQSEVLIVADLGSYFVAKIAKGKGAAQSSWTEVERKTELVTTEKDYERDHRGRFARPGGGGGGGGGRARARRRHPLLPFTDSTPVHDGTTRTSGAGTWTPQLTADSREGE